MKLSELKQSIKALGVAYPTREYVSLQKVLEKIEAFEEELQERLNGNIKQLQEIPTSCRTKYAIDFLKELLQK